MNNLSTLIERKHQSRLAAYRNESGDIREHAGIEETVLAGGYGYRQVLELVQNGADAILEECEESGHSRQEARIAVALSDRHLYVANTGAVLSEEGVVALLQSHSSPKRGNQIGRFGLGFKSLLRLGGRIDLFSRSGSMRFDPERCREEIREEFGLPDDTPVAALRLAWALDRNNEVTADPILADFPWATTIVRAEILEPDMLSHLRKEIWDFPSPFLLFLPVAVSLDLDAGEGAKRLLRRQPDGPDLILHDGDNASRWRVVEQPEVRITDEAAINDATHLHARDKVPLAWAIPLDAPEERGRFWAFFPTDTPTYLPGILNAPWKLNSDRKALIPGDWNTTLMREAAKIVAEHLSKLATEDDPGRPLDVFPRQLQRQDEPAAPLIIAIWDTLRNAQTIADAHGVLRTGAELRRPPILDRELQEQWCELAGEDAKSRWVHPSCLASKERCARLEELANRLAPSYSARKQEELREQLGMATRPYRLEQAKASAWFAEITSTYTADPRLLFQLAGTYATKREVGIWAGERASLAIIPTTDGELRVPGELVIAPAEIEVPGRKRIAPCLENDPDTLRLLTEVLGVRWLDDDGWRGLLASALQIEDWKQAWELLHSAPEHVCNEFLAKSGKVTRVRRRDRNWVLPDKALLPGSIVSADDALQSNLGVLIDDSFHEHDSARLKAIGVCEAPMGNIGPGAYGTVVGDNRYDLEPWLDVVESDYRSKLDTSSSPQSGYLRPLSLSLPRGWMLLAQIRGLANAKLTRHFLAALDSLGGMVEFGHTSRKDAYPKTSVSHPMRWYIREYGSVAIGKAAVPLKSLVARPVAAALAKVDDWQAIEFALNDLIGAPAPAKPNAKQLTALWQALLRHLATLEAIASDTLARLWEEAAKDGQVPDKLSGPNGDVVLAECYVTGSSNLARRARQQGNTVITLDADTLMLWRARGARSLDDLYKPEWSDTQATAVALETAIPDLADVLSEEAKHSALCLEVRELKLLLDGQPIPMPCLQWQGVLHLDVEQLDKLSRVDRLAAIIDEAAAAGWLQVSLAEARRRIADAQVEANRARVAAGANLAQRLLNAVGSRSEPLLECLGQASRKVIPDDCQSLQLAELALAMHGPTILQKLKDTLRQEGMQPPDRWGGDEARAFVTSLGFPETFAVASETKREAEEVITGPIPLPPLHDYQEEVVAGLRKLIERGDGRRRAVVSLPTGGGKTRVTVQAAVDLVLRPVGSKRSVIWVAQTDELCEQAVQAFRQVWLNWGTERTNLRIVRFWGGHKNPSPSQPGQPTALVASIQTLNSRLIANELDWLSSPGLVVLDECHHAITKSYTQLLRWLDADAARAGKEKEEEPPIVGLSATPFRGSNDDEENLRLAKRFDQNWLPSNQHELHEKLMKGGMLATAVHEALKSPTILPDELIDRMSRQSDTEGPAFENLLRELNDLLADDEDRNRLLVETIQKSAEKSILLFANSVGHAEEMAARLNLAGIAAAAVSGDTPPSARRHFLDQFQQGGIRVLCNHSVLTTGFDAPKTDMVLISRQVFSAVRYMQMVGRGLRGEKNGGTAHCRIVTVTENLGRFSDRQPYQICAKFFMVAD